MTIKKQRTYIYVDGFNLYYGVLKNTPYKWLDLMSLFQKLLNDSHDIQAIKYYTARISVRDNHQQAPIKQQIYIRALQTYIPECSVYYGHYLTHAVTLPLVHNSNTKKRQFVNVLKSEEKGSDVNLAVHLLNDAWLDKYDCAVIVSNDSDLSESMKLVKEQHKKTIGLITPSNNHNRKPTQMLRQYADFIKYIRKGILNDSLLPNIIPGTKIHKPKNW
ncbi:MAG: hypothetical protein AMJ43_05840 [Coxiella sp. DG_40]|nr:MAG: hypothetical protein AMJ43_05840 [Coxiella sp. DG_40]